MIIHGMVNHNGAVGGTARVLPRENGGPLRRVFEKYPSK
jgi:DMSO/TMAO reductase YedYZ molybdopterin-dependent catalytic subunit